MNEIKIPRPNPLAYLSSIILVMLKSDESNILQLAIHLFSNRHIILFII